MTEIKERLIGAVTVMDDEMASQLWNIILTDFTSPSWDSIETVEPDKWDLEMLDQIKIDPECHEFTPEADIDWGD